MFLAIYWRVGVCLLKSKPETEIYLGCHLVRVSAEKFIALLDILYTLANFQLLSIFKNFYDPPHEF